MNPIDPDNSGRQDASSDARQGRVLEELSGVLARQKARAQQGDAESVQGLIAESQRLLRDLKGAGPLTPQSEGKLAVLLKSHREVELILAAARQKTSDRLANLGRGKNALRGYRS
jgi:hypothetical protein